MLAEMIHMSPSKLRSPSTVIFFLAVALLGPSPLFAAEPLTIVVMDPLALPLSCPCVEGHAQRDYDKLGKFLAERLDRPVKVFFSEDLGKALRGTVRGTIDLIIGKQSVVRFDAAENHLSVRPVRMLTGNDGGTTLTGLFVVGKGDPAKQLGDLKGYTTLFGPVESDEKHAAALTALRQAGVDLPENPEVRDGCSDAALEIVDDEGKTRLAAVISSYAMPLLEGCHTIDKGALRMIGRTAPVPFITVFATERVDADTEKRIHAALKAVAENAELLKAMESRRGFVKMPPQKPATGDEHSSVPRPTSSAWPGWRGANRDAIVPRLPLRLSSTPKFLWTSPLTSIGLAGIAATEKNVIVADRDPLDQKDIFRCFDAANGAERWCLKYSAPGKLDYGNSPRAAPLIHRSKAYMLGAFGDLHCVDMVDGRVLWKKNIVREYKANLVTWGMCASPLMVDGKLIVNPGAAEASVVALDGDSGKEVWRCAGAPAAYSSFIVGRFGRIRQIVGYDALSLGGWDIQTGKRLWTLIPPEDGDFNVPTPIALDGRLLVSSENNGTRLYDFDDCGVICPTPSAEHCELAPDASTPIVIDGKVFGCCRELFCLDAANLKGLWTSDDDAFDDYVSITGGSGRVLIATIRGDLILLNTSGVGCEVISRMTAFDDGEMLSHPAIVGDRLYLRGANRAYCIELE